MGGLQSSHEQATSCATASNRHSYAYEPSGCSPEAANTPSLRAPPPPARASSAPPSRDFFPPPNKSPDAADDAWGLQPTNSDTDPTSPARQSAFRRFEPSRLMSRNEGPQTIDELCPQRPTSRQNVTSLEQKSETNSDWLASSVYYPELAAAREGDFVAEYSAAAAADDDAADCCECKSEVEALTRELASVRAALTRSRETVAALKEKEKELRQRLSEQARRQFSRGSTVFEDISAGPHTRPTELVRRYGNLYAETRLDALDALDELVEVAQFKNLKSKLLLSVVVLAFRNARKHHDDIRTKVKKLLQIHQVTGSSAKSRRSKASAAAAAAAAVAAAAAAHDFTPASGCRTEDADVMARELDDVISMYLRRMVEHHNLTRNYEEVCDRVWSTLYDFPTLRRCTGLLRFIDESVRLAWALSVQQPPLVIDYETTLFNADTHTRFHSSDADSDVIKCVVWPMLREGEGGFCLYKGVVIT